MSFQSFIIIGAILITLSSCGKQQNIEQVVAYNGPVLESDNVETLYSDSAVLRVRLKAAKQLELQNGDQDFPKGVYIEFFNEKGIKSSTLTSNKGTYKKEENLYVVKGNVIVEDLLEKKSLKSEELKWDPKTKKVYTDKFVEIIGPDEILTGQGLDALQDFSWYKIRKPIATFSVDE